eukprot:g3223.t1
MSTEGAETSNSGAFSVVIGQDEGSSSTLRQNELENEENHIRQPLLEIVPESDEQVQNALGASNSRTNMDRVGSPRIALSSEGPLGACFKQALDDFNTESVQDFLKRIINDSIPFDTGAQMIKDNIGALLMEYRTLFESMLKNNDLSKKVCTIQVPVEIFEDESNIGITIGTCSSISELTALSEKDNAFEDWPSMNKNGVTRILKKTRGRMVTATVRIFRLADVCKTGASGIIRSFLMLEAPASVFKTPLIKSIIDFKWENTWKFRAWRRLAFYLAFLVIVNLTVLAIGLKWLRGSSVTIQDIIAWVIIALLIMVAIDTLWGEFFQLKRYIRDGRKILPSNHLQGLKHYFKSRQSQIDLALGVSLLTLFTLCLLLICGMDSNEAISTTYLWFLAIVELLIWAKTLYLAQAIKRIQILVLTIRRVLWKCLPYFGLLFGFMVGFGFTMYVALLRYLVRAEDILKCYDEWSHYQDWESNCILRYFPLDLIIKCLSASDSPDISWLYCYRELISEVEDRQRITEFFGTPLKSILTMGYAMVGLFDPEVLFRSGDLTGLVITLFVIYIALQSIVMFNILIAATGDTFDGVRAAEEESYLMARAEFIDQYEALLREKAIRTIDGKIGKYLCVLVPKDEQVGKIASLWRGRMTTIKEDVRKIALNSHEDTAQKIYQQSEKIDQLTQKVDRQIGSEHQSTQNMNQLTQNISEMFAALKSDVQSFRSEIRSLEEKITMLEK